MWYENNFPFLFFIPLAVIAKRPDVKTVKEQLTEINSCWKEKEIAIPLLQQTYNLSRDIEKIQLHLSLVEATLRKASTKNLNSRQLNNRNNCLDILHVYLSKGAFPKNTFHQIKTPYFIDIYGTYCAVGYLIKETGYDAVAQKIHQENNYGYLKDLNSHYAEIGVWANEFGFTVDELAWIQPTYGPVPYNNFGTDSFQHIQNVSCNGIYNGNIILPDSNFITNLPFVSATINPIGFPNNLNIGWYSITAMDAMGNTVFFGGYIGADDSISAVPAISHVTCNGNCDGTISLNNVTGGTPPYSYQLQNNVQNINLFDSLCAGWKFVTITDVNGCYTNFFEQVLQPPSLNVISNAISPIICFGDTLEMYISATGGVSPYINTGLYNFPAGTHTLTITDATGCMKDTIFTISEPTPLLLHDSIVTPILCYGDSAIILIAASGGVSPYSGTGTFNIAAGTQQINVTDSYGCIVDTLIFINQPPQLSIADSTVTPILCNGDSATVFITASGGIAPYNGIGIYNFPGGAQLISITDSNGCQLDTFLLISQPAQFLVSDTIISPILCYGDSASIFITASGGTTPYNNIGNFFKPAGMFSYNITDANNCMLSDSLFINGPALLTAILTSTPDNGTGNGMASANTTGGTPPYTYLWSNAANTDVISGLQFGWYTVNISDGILCSYTDSVYVEVKFPQGISATAYSLVNVNPNPSTGFFMIELDKLYQHVELKLYDITGRLIFSDEYQQLSNTSLHINEAPGIYYLSVEADGKKSMIKLSKK